MRATCPSLALAALLLLPPLHAAGEAMPIFDAHVHYSHDAWDNLPTADAIAILRKAGLKRALVSSSGDEGTQRLVAAAPELVIPSLRPYRTRGEIGTWVRDDTVITFLEDRLRRHRYAAIGEFHLYGADADLPVPQTDGGSRQAAPARPACALRRRRDRTAVPARSAGADPVGALRLRAGGQGARPFAQARQPVVRSGLPQRARTAGKVPPEWRALFTEFPDRFTVGTDTFTPERWHYIPEHANWSRAWLADLPPALAERIAWRNGEALFAFWKPSTAH